MIDRLNIYLKKNLGSILFWLQIIFAGFFCISELLHILNHSAEGLSMTMFVSVEVFLGINLYLSYRAYKNLVDRGKKAAETKKQLLTYLYWFVLWGACLAVASYKLLQDFSTIWSFSEYVTTASVVVGLSLVFIGAKIKNLTFEDSMVKGYTALVFKSFPQVGQAWKFYAFGGMSWGLEGLLFGHATILIRIAQLYLSKREAGKWTRELRASRLSEFCNEASWLLATMVWLLWELFGIGL